MTASAQVSRGRDACVECGGAATLACTYPVSGKPGVRVRLPICGRCRELEQLKFIAWVVGLVVATVAVVAVAALAADALVPVDLQRAHTSALVIATLLPAPLPLWLGLRNGRQAFHARFSRQRFTDDEHAAGPYRSPPLRRSARSAPPLSYTAIALLGLAVLGGGVARWLEITHAAARGRSFSLRSVEVVLHGIAGRWGVLGLYAVTGIAIFVVGMRGIRRALRDRP
jgi:hypothetical protein